jgi:release factor H-coupled RctB family protein
MRAISEQTRWLHRKGAAPADQGPVVIPGSRGSLSYLVVPQGDLAGCAWSLAHGAGRKWARSDCKRRLSHRYSLESLSRTEMGSRVICEDKDLIYEEAPQAYKDVDIVVQDLAEAGFLRVVAMLRPLITYKTRRKE